MSKTTPPSERKSYTLKSLSDDVERHMAECETTLRNRYHLCDEDMHHAHMNAERVIELALELIPHRRTAYTSVANLMLSGIAGYYAALCTDFDAYAQLLSRNAATNPLTFRVRHESDEDIAERVVAIYGESRLVPEARAPHSNPLEIANVKETLIDPEEDRLRIITRLPRKEPKKGRE